MKIWIVLGFFLVVLLLGGSAAWTTWSSPGVVDLTKVEALALQNSLVTLRMAQGDWNETVRLLEQKYSVHILGENSVTPTHRLNVAQGLIEPLSGSIAKEAPQELQSPTQ